MKSEERVTAQNKNDRRPNVVIIIADDLTFGDLGVHGNPVARTPNLDKLFGQSTRLTHYYSGPVCTPARAALMTGRYPYRTRALDTYCGRSQMDPDEITLPEILSAAGYRTGIFGKWHLGDCYPMRPNDKGFQESLVHGGGGLDQPANPTLNNGYFNPDLRRNGEVVSTVGYCTDIFTDAAIDFIRRNKNEPFFTYLATNVPHCPFDIGEEWVTHYRQAGINEKHARIYGMIENLDMNIGRVMTTLDELGLADDTILIFTSDHGWCPSSLHEGQPRFNAGLRDGKGSMFNGGLKVPCFWRWPNRFAAGRDMDRLCNPIDMLPTLAAACGATVPADRPIDGKNLLPLLRGEIETSAWPDRSVCVQWHRGDVPQRWRNSCIITQQWKLVNGRELYDQQNDWSEKDDRAEEHPEVVSDLRQAYDRWFDDVSTTRGPGTFDAPRIRLGTPHESATYLTWQDWRMQTEDGWTEQTAGHWDVVLTRPGPYAVTLRFSTRSTEGHAHVSVGGTHQVIKIPTGAESCEFPEIRGAIGPGRVEAWLHVGNEVFSPRIVEVR